MMLSLSLPVYQVRLTIRLVTLVLFCLDSAQPAELYTYLSNSVGRAFALYGVCHRLDSHLSSSIVSFYLRKEMYRFIGLGLIYVGLTVPMCVW